jgi:DNA polymerase I
VKIVIDIECNKLINPDKIWLIVCKDIDKNEYHYFRNVTEDVNERERFIRFNTEVNLDPNSTYIGHNYLGYDYPVLNSHLKLYPEDHHPVCIDTLILSKLVDYSREGGHSIEQYGKEFGIEKGKFSDWSKWSQAMEDYCVRDVDICHQIYLKYLPIISDHSWAPSISLEQEFQLVCNKLHTNGFAFNTTRASALLTKVKEDLKELDDKILKQFPPRQVLQRVFTPRATKYGTINRTSVPRSLHHNIHLYSIGVEYPVYSTKEFNPSSHKQVIEVLNEAGWAPYDKTQTHINTERELQRLKYTHSETKAVDSERLSAKLIILQKSGWKINENNLSTLPGSAPSPARTLAKRILLESRRRTLTEWLGLVEPDGRIRGQFQGIGAWTHRMSHQKPNTANIPNDLKEDLTKKLLGKELRSLWQAPRNRLLVGVDAEGIQLRIFAHYINDEEFTDALVRGKKADKTDPHSLNQRVLGSVCKSRQAAKRFVYALLLGGGIGKLAFILDCTIPEAQAALDRLLERYTGFSSLKQSVIPKDAKKGYFIGLDGRKVSIPGSTVGERKHLCMSGYLQNGEAIVMKKATLKWHDKLKDHKALLVDLVHDEWQTEVPNDLETAILVAQIQADSLKEVGEELGLRCPLAGSFWNDDKHDYTIGTSWYKTH